MFKANFSIPGTTGRQIAIADTLEQPIGIMVYDRGFPAYLINIEDINRCFLSGKRRYINNWYTIQNGADQMTEYTSF